MCARVQWALRKGWPNERQPLGVYVVDDNILVDILENVQEDLLRIY